MEQVMTTYYNLINELNALFNEKTSKIHEQHFGEDYYILMLRNCTRNAFIEFCDKHSIDKDKRTVFLNMLKYHQDEYTHKISTVTHNFFKFYCLNYCF